MYLGGNYRSPLELSRLIQVQNRRVINESGVGYWSEGSRFDYGARFSSKSCQLFILAKAY